MLRDVEPPFIPDGAHGMTVPMFTLVDADELAARRDRRHPAVTA